MKFKCIGIFKKNTNFRKCSLDGHDQILLQPKSVVCSQTEIPSGFPYSLYHLCISKLSKSLIVLDKFNYK